VAESPRRGLRAGAQAGETAAHHAPRVIRLEYGTDSLEIHEDAITAGQKVLIVDDLLATGGTAAATVGLVRSLGADVVGVQFLIELVALGGRAKLLEERVHTVLAY